MAVMGAAETAALSRAAKLDNRRVFGSHVLIAHLVARRWATRPQYLSGDRAWATATYDGLVRVDPFGSWARAGVR